MDAHTRQSLIEINRRFYADFAGSFASTRRRIQPGVRGLLARLPDAGSWLDLGCGSGWLAVEWLRAGRKSAYLGLDFSAGLLAEAQDQIAQEAGEKDAAGVSFREADLSRAAWSEGFEPGSFRGALCFAVLHHLPGAEQRRAFLNEAAGLLEAGGMFAFSVWQFQNSPRLRARQVEWERVGLHDADLEEGDALLDWRQDPGREPGLRYVHRFTPDELARLAAQSGFSVREQFESDGHGGNLSLYQVWQKDVRVAADSAGPRG